MKHRIISRIPLFASLPRGEKEILAACLSERHMGGNQLLMREGERGECFYIILSGEVEVVKGLGTSDERVLSKLGPGECIGEMSLLEREGLRVASVRSLSPVHILEMTRSHFDDLLKNRPSIAYEIARALSLRLRDTDNAVIRDLQRKNHELAKAYLDLQRAQKEIVQKQKLERELEVAREIQESILPRSLPKFQGYDFGARMTPARAVGGDLFDFIPLGPDKLGIAVGDVSGKGVPAAIFMAMTRSLLRAEARRNRSPLKALQGVNRHLIDMNDADMFVTMLYGVLSRSTRVFNYVRAGHDLPIVCRENGEIVGLSVEEGQPLGLFNNPAIDQQSITLPGGSSMLIYTDGVTEAVNEQGELFGKKRLLQLMRTQCRKSAQSTCDQIMHNVLDFQGCLPQHDDVILVAVRAMD